jgi:hypothetical protein
VRPFPASDDFLALGAGFAVAAFLLALLFARALGGLCASLGLPFGLRLGGLLDRGLRLRSISQGGDALPDALGPGSLAALVSGSFLNATAPGRLFQMPASRSAGQDAASSANCCSLVKLSKGVWVVAAASSGVRKRHNLVLFVDRKGCHFYSPVTRPLCGHHMDHSEVPERQGNSARNLRWRCNGDHTASGAAGASQMTADVLR